MVVTSKKVKHVVTKLTLVAKFNIEKKKTAKVVEVVNTLNVKRCNEMRAYEVRIKEKEHELDVSMKDADLESTKALGNRLVIEEAKILAERQEKKTVQINRVFWAEKIAQDNTKLLKEVEGQKKPISETQAKGIAKLFLADTKQTKSTERKYSQKFAKEETKSRKDKCSHEVTLSLISEKHEKEDQRWNTRVSEMETNFDQERAKSKNNLDEVKALVYHQTHKFHEKNILCREAVATQVEKRKEVLKTPSCIPIFCAGDPGLPNYPKGNGERFRAWIIKKYPQ